VTRHSLYVIPMRVGNTLFQLHQMVKLINPNELLAKMDGSLRKLSNLLTNSQDWYSNILDAWTERRTMDVASKMKRDRLSADP
jgi:ABC-type transporter lipoprotein component MlaA